VFVNYESTTVSKAASPSGIPAEIPKFLPTIGEVSNWLSKRTEYENRVNRYAALPLPEFRPVLIDHANLFVPNSVDGFLDMVDRAKKAPAKFHRYEKDHICIDGELKDGIWVPNEWWEERRGRARSSGLQSVGDFV